MQIAAEHAERQGVGAGNDMEEWLLLSRIAGECSNVICGHTQVTTFVEPDLADPAFAIVNEAAMTACKTFECTILEMFS